MFVGARVGVLGDLDGFFNEHNRFKAYAISHLWVYLLERITSDDVRKGDKVGLLIELTVLIKTHI